ncbi:MAG TPA: DUF5134 domain-containing protein [Streptosporangiaceae bacterium]|nr:DUF5134 domain-containing protein [Streptosporangiaceae bacterium]
MIPAPILGVFAAIMLIVAALSACRLVASRSWSRPAPDSDIDGAHILMGIAMAGMLATGLRTLSNLPWVAVFAVVTGWFGWRVAAETRAKSGPGAKLASHHLPHLIHGAAMMYMFAAVTTTAASGGSQSGQVMSDMSGVGGMGTLSVPVIGLAFVLIMAAWAVWDVDQLSVSGHRHAARPPQPVMPNATTTTNVTAAWPGARVERPDSCARQALLDPRVAIAGRIAMGVTMALMLVLLI